MKKTLRRVPFREELETSNALGACFSGLNTLISRIYAYISEIKLKQSRLDKSAQTLRATVMTIMTIIHERNSCMYNVNETRGTYERNSSKDNYMTMSTTAMNSYSLKYFVE